MPTLRPLTAEEIVDAKKQGLDPSKLMAQDEDTQQESTQEPSKGILPTIGKTALAHGGSYLGGGAGLAAFAAAPFTEGLSLVPAAIGGAGAAMGGSYLGQKLQQLIGGKKQEELEEEANKLGEENPITAGATDIVGSALAGGGKLSLKNLKAAGGELLGKNALNDADSAVLAHLGEGDLGTRGTEALAGQTEGKAAIGKIIGSSILNPAINTGLDLATGQPVTAGGIASQVAGGALFSEQSRLGEWMHSHGKPTDEPLPEVSNKDITTDPTDDEGSSIFTAKDESGNYNLSDALVKQEFLKQNITPKSDLAKLPRDQALLAQQENMNHRANNDYESMRQSLHKAALDSQSEQTAKATDVNKPSDQNNGATTPTQPVSEQPNITEANKAKPPVDEADPATQLDLQQRAAASREAERQAGGKITGTTENPLLQKEQPSAASSDNNTSTQAAETTARTTSLLDATREYHKALISGEGIAEAKAKADGEQQRFAYHIQELAKADQIKRAALDKEAAQQSAEGESLAANAKAKQAAQEQAAIEAKAQAGLQPKRAPLNPEKSNMLRIVNPDTLLPNTLNETHGLHTFENLDNWLESKKFDSGYLNESHGGFDSLGAIGKAAWNTSIDVVRSSLKAGKALHDAIKDGIEHIKKNYPNLKFDEDAYVKEMTKQEGEQGHPFQKEKGTTSGKEVVPSIKRMGKLGGVMQPIYDRIGELAHPRARAVSDAFKLTDNTKDRYLGESWGKIKSTMDRVGFTKADGERLDKIAQWENLNHAKAPLNMFTSRAQRAVYNVERQVYDEVGKRRIANNEPVYRNGVPTILRQDPTSHPTPLAPKVAEIYRAGTDITSIKKYDADFIKNALSHGYTPDKAASALADFKETMHGKMSQPGSNLSFFGGSRLSQGIPLPESFTKGGYATRLESYYKRMALDNAFYKHVESDKNVMSALGESKDAWGRPIPKDAQSGIANNDNVRTALQHFQGEATDTTSRTEGSITNLASTLFVSSPVIEMHKILSNTLNGALAISDNPLEAAKTFAHMITHMSDGIEHATENGLIKMTAKSASDFFDNAATTAEKLQSLSQGWRNISSLGGKTDKWNNGLMQAGFESIIPSKIARAAKGDTTAQQLLKKWDPTYTVGKQYDTKAIQELASVAAGYVHGTKDGRTMPPWMMKDTELSGFFKLAHWSVSQTNRFMSDVYTPATKGNVVPLVNALLGSAVGGYVIKQLREELQGKHGNIPDLNEIGASQEGVSGNKGLAAYNLIAALQYAGFAGILSQGVKTPIDWIHKNSPQGAVFPLDEIATDLVKQVGHLTTAAANDPNFDWGDASMALWNHILSTDIQLTRIGFNQGVNNGLITGYPADKKILSDKLGQLRRFDMVSGLPYEDQEPSQANPYMNIEQKKFKNEQDIGKAMSEVPGLINNIIETYHDKPDVMMSKLKALKMNQFETFPSLADKAPSFVKYMDYLGKLKGKNDADSEYMDYLQHKMINEAKASAVP